MENSQEKTLEALQTAIQMEIDGKEFYLKASQNSSNEMGRKLLQSLSNAEDVHRQRFVSVYDNIRSEKSWPVIIIPPDESKKITTLFSMATREMADNTKPLSSELEAIETGMDMEKKSIDFYQYLDSETSDKTEKDFYQAITAEEREHHRVLLDYYDYLKDPAGWFVKTEHPSLDGG